MNMDKTTYHTKDIWEASLLYTTNKKLIHTDTVNGKIWFSFADKISCEEAVEAYLRKELSVNAKEFVEAIKTLKGLIFNREAIGQFCAK